MNHFRNYITFVSFICIILFFLLNQFVPIVKDTEYNENKKKAEKPKFDVNRLDAYPKLFEQYLSDNFSLRGYFLKEIGEINTKVWLKSPKPDKLIIGKNNWLYNVDSELNCFLGKNNFTNEQLKTILNEFNFRKRVLDSMGIEMCIVINPTKYSVYPEFLPDYLSSNTNKSAAFQLIDYFKKNSNLNIIYTRDFVMQHKSEHQLYYKGDNHWNQIGGYYAARGILNNLKMDIPEIPYNKFCIDTVPDYVGNLANMAASAKDFAEPSFTLSLCESDAPKIERFKYEPIKGFPYPWDYQKSFCSKNSKLPNALIIRDSYGSALIPYLKNSFNYSTFIFDSWQYGFNFDIIKQEKPDVVIYMVLESLLQSLHTRAITKR